MSTDKQEHWLKMTSREVWREKERKGGPVENWHSITE